jgi:hypothetical protein
MISGASLNAIDVESGTVTGNIQWSDLVERCYADDEFVGYIIPEEVGYERFLVRPHKENGLTGEYHFTLLSYFNKELERHIIPMVVETYKQVYKKPPQIDSDLLTTSISNS